MTTTRLMRVLIAALTAGVAACQIDRPTGVSPADTEQDIQRPSDASGALDPSGNCPDCRVGPVTFVRETGAPRVVTRTFAATAGQTFVVDLDDLGSRGADAVVTLNGVTLLGNRANGDASSRHYRGAVTAEELNTLEVRLLGKPGSVLRVAIWLYRPVTIDATSLVPNKSVEVGEDPSSFATTVTNHTSAALIGLYHVTTVRQPNAERTGLARDVVGCSSTAGTLPRGTCVITTWIDGGNWTGGFGGFDQGPADVIVTLYDGAGNELATRSVPIILEPTPKVPASVQVAPMMATIAVGQQLQMTATIRADDGTVLTGRFLHWASSNPGVASVTQSGLVVGVGPGFALITATTGNNKTGGAEVNVTPSPN